VGDDAAIDEHEAALGVDDQADAAEAGRLHAVDLVRQGDDDGDERGGEGEGARIVGLGGGGGQRGGGGRGRGRRELARRPDPRIVVAVAADGAEDLALDGDHADSIAPRRLDVEVADRQLGAVRGGGEARLEGGEVRGRLAADRGDDGAAIEAGGGEHGAGAGDVDASQGDLELAGDLVGEVVEGGAAELDEARWGDRVEVEGGDADLLRSSASIDLEGDLAADVIVEVRLEGDEVEDRVTVDAEEDVPEGEVAVGGAFGEDRLDDEQAGGRRGGGAKGGFALGAQAEAAELVVGA
jgi:hypothetical protein